MTDENVILPAGTVAQWFLDTHQDIDLKHLDDLTRLVERARNDTFNVTQNDLLSRIELVRYFRTEEYADEIADIISNFPPAEYINDAANKLDEHGPGRPGQYLHQVVPSDPAYDGAAGGRPAHYPVGPQPPCKTGGAS